MPDSNNRTGRDFSEYDEMNDEQLRQILREDASKTEGEDTDLELMLHIMEVLARRRRETSEDISPEESLEQFKKKYTYTDNSLISEEKATRKKTVGFSRWQKWVATIAALLVLVFGSAITAQAFGFDLFEIIAKWTKETFHFGYVSDIGETNEPSPDTELPYASLRDALAKYKIEAKLVPTWIPEGYTEGEVQTKESPMQRLFIAKYEHGDNSIRLRIADYLGGFPLQIEQSETLVEKYISDGIEYYIFDNESQMQVAWVNEHYECYLTGPLSLAEIKSIIDSIEKG